MYETDIVLGKTYKDRISGYEGVADSVYFYLNGCVRVNLVSKKLHEGKVVDATFDEQCLESVNTTAAENLRKKLKPDNAPVSSVGGPRSTPRRTGH